MDPRDKPEDDPKRLERWLDVRLKGATVARCQGGGSDLHPRAELVEARLEAASSVDELRTAGDFEGAGLPHRSTPSPLEVGEVAAVDGQDLAGDVGGGR